MGVDVDVKRCIEELISLYTDCLFLFGKLSEVFSGVGERLLPSNVSLRVCNRCGYITFLRTSVCPVCGWKLETVSRNERFSVWCSSFRKFILRRLRGLEFLRLLSERVPVRVERGRFVVFRQSRVRFVGDRCVIRLSGGDVCEDNVRSLLLVLLDDRVRNDPDVKVLVVIPYVDAVKNEKFLLRVKFRWVDRRLVLSSDDIRVLSKFELFVRLLR